MMEVYSEGYCIPSVMDEVDNLSVIVQRMHWQVFHDRMREERN